MTFCVLENLQNFEYVLTFKLINGLEIDVSHETGIFHCDMFNLLAILLLHGYFTGLEKSYLLCVNKQN